MCLFCIVSALTPVPMSYSGLISTNVDTTVFTLPTGPCSFQLQGSMYVETVPVTTTVIAYLEFGSGPIISYRQWPVTPAANALTSYNWGAVPAFQFSDCAGDTIQIRTAGGTTFGITFQLFINFLSNEVSPIYSDTSVIKPLPNLYLSPTAYNALSRSAHFHACVNETGNYNSGPLFLAPNGTCGFTATVGVSTYSNSGLAQTSGGLNLNNRTIILATTVGSQSIINTNTFLDECALEINSVFVNTTIPYGLACVDITLALNNGPNFVGQSLTSHLKLNSDCYWWGGGYTCSPYVVGTNQIVMGGFSANYYYSVSMSASCSLIGPTGVTFSITNGTITNTYTLSQTTTSRVDSFTMFLQIGELVIQTFSLVNTVTCKFLLELVPKSTPFDLDGGYYSTSYSGGIPQQWFYPLNPIMDTYYVEQRDERSIKYKYK